MDLFLVYDTKGAGRLVGVFDRLDRAQSVAAINPNYFRLHRCAFNALKPDVLPWALSPEERDRLAAALAGTGYRSRPR